MRSYVPRAALDAGRFDLSCIGLVTTLGEIVEDGLGVVWDTRGRGELLIAEADGGCPQWP